MKRRGILHPQLCHLLASTGHVDAITICDRGFPVPIGPERIDLALVDDIPTVLDVLRAVNEEYHFGRVIITHEMEQVSPERANEVHRLMAEAEVEAVSHHEFKEMSRESRGIVRTADTVPYANLIIISG